MSKSGYRWYALLAIGLLTLASCVGPGKRPLQFPPHSLLPPASLGTEVAAYMQLELNSQEGRRVLQLALEVEAESLELVVMDQLGRRLATQTYLAGDYQLELEPGAPKTLPYRQLLFALQIVFWPLEALNGPDGPGGWAFRQHDGRSAWYNDQLIANVSFLETSSWTGTYELHNQLDGTHLKLQSVALP